jgi:ATP-dependent DNA ligase
MPVFYLAFDLIVLSWRNLAGEPLECRRELLQQRVLTKLKEPIQHTPELEASLPDLIASARAKGLEGLVAKRRDSSMKLANAPEHGRRCPSTRPRSL